ncbi:sigma factor-like helix-turn-helix DNA-binding protein [Embleya sp. NBC_00888]|uniref:sigma factor-like helix-turn-helix DNA-binding protein n=1 Tax=Embleya sp. NBC_00888 TaxID=2975960 RepID=UPI003869D6A0
MWRPVAALPTKQRQAVAYHHFAGLPHRDVAELIGGPRPRPAAPRPTASRPCAHR